MKFSYKLIKVFLAILICFATPAANSENTATQKIEVVATFSIIADMAKQVGGNRINVIELVPAGGDAHVFRPSTAHAKQISKADIVFSNGLGFEGWIERLIKSVNYSGKHFVVSEGINPLLSTDNSHQHSFSNGKNNDPHAWQSLDNALIYSENILNGLCEIDINNCDYYRKNAKKFQEEIKILNDSIIQQWQEIPQSRRKIITSHGAFQYYSKAYQVEFLSPQGISTHAEATAKDVAQLIQQIKKENIKAIFTENQSSKKLINLIAKETGIAVSGELYLDSPPKNFNSSYNSSYLAMIKYNTNLMIQSVK